MNKKRIIILLSTLAILFGLLPLEAKSRLQEVRERITPTLETSLSKHGLQLGDHTYLRVFKHERVLELWMKPRGKNEYILYKSYPIAGMSGQLGPKLKEGDYQAPEGFYNIVKGNLNPKSRYHLSFNIGYPNSYDRFHKRTGSFIMVHGSDVSIGCYAMTDPVIEVVYLIVEAALKNKQSSIPFHSFPFRYSDNWESEIRSKWNPFWKALHPAYLIFEKEKRIPSIAIRNGEYVCG